MSKRSYYAVIPAEVRYSERLQASAKLMYGEVTALCNEKGFCWASNQYFAEMYGASERNVRRWIESLAREGFIRVEVKGTQRKIYIVEADKNVRVSRTKMSASGGQKCPHNNIGITTGNKLRAPSVRASFKGGMDDIVPTDEEGNELKPKKKAGAAARNKVALKLQLKFIEMCGKQVGIKPVQDFKGYRMVLYALNTGGLTEAQILDLFDEWFGLGKSDEDTIQLTRALSTNQINNYKVRNNITSK